MPEIRDISAHQRLGLLDQLLRGESYELKYTEHNKPFLKGRREKISISHSHDMLAVMCDTRAETGVDVELLRDKELRIRHKFLTSSE